MRPDVADTGMHMSARYDGAVRHWHLLTNEHNLNSVRWRTGSQPVQVVAHSVSDVVELALAGDP